MSVRQTKSNGLQNSSFLFNLEFQVPLSHNPGIKNLQGMGTEYGLRISGTIRRKGFHMHECLHCEVRKIYFRIDLNFWNQVILAQHLLSKAFQFFDQHLDMGRIQSKTDSVVVSSESFKEVP